MKRNLVKFKYNNQTYYGLINIKESTTGRFVADVFNLDGNSIATNWTETRDDVIILHAFQNQFYVDEVGPMILELGA